MSLDISKLQKVVDLAGGMKRARCPACAEQGQDKTGNHLRVYPDGRFGCCVHPKDGGHRKRIFALAGEKLSSEHKPRSFTVKVAKMNAPAPAESVKQSLERFLGTLGTGSSMSRAYEREDNTHHIYKDTDTAVPSVPTVKAESEAGTDLPEEAMSERPAAGTARLSADQLPWLGVAERVLAHEFERADDSTIESLTIGLRGIAHPICQKALARLRPNKEKPPGGIRNGVRNTRPKRPE